MNNDINNQERIIREIIFSLDDLKAFLCGKRNEPVETCEEVKPNCLFDRLNRNSQGLEYALKIAVELNNIIKGEER